MCTFKSLFWSLSILALTSLGQGRRHHHWTSYNSETQHPLRHHRGKFPIHLLVLHSSIQQFFYCVCASSRVSASPTVSYFVVCERVFLEPSSNRCLSLFVFCYFFFCSPTTLFLICSRPQWHCPFFHFLFYFSVGWWKRKLRDTFGVLWTELNVFFSSPPSPLFPSQIYSRDNHNRHPCCCLSIMWATVVEFSNCAKLFGHEFETIDFAFFSLSNHGTRALETPFGSYELETLFLPFS